MEADGDPSVFNMNLHVLRPESGDMMKLVKYDLIGGADPTAETLEIYHNHVLGVPDMSNESADIEDAIAEAGRDTGDVTDLGIKIITEGDTDITIGTPNIVAPITLTSTLPNWLTMDAQTAGTAVTFDTVDGLIEANTMATVEFNKGTTAYKVTFVIADNS